MVRPQIREMKEIPCDMAVTLFSNVSVNNQAIISVVVRRAMAASLISASEI